MNKGTKTMVWDLFVRIFHWLFVLFFFLAYVTGDEKGPFHRYIGYMIFVIVTARIYWGFFGTRHALFKKFVCSPLKAIKYLQELTTGKPTHYTGHNPAAAWMILLLLTTSLVICLSGYMACKTKGGPYSFDANQVFSFAAPAYADHDARKAHGNKHQGRIHRESEGKSREDSFWGEFHEAAANFMLSLVFLHIVGVFISSWMHNENLVKSMITGSKT